MGLPGVRAAQIAIAFRLDAFAACVAAVLAVGTITWAQERKISESLD